MLMLYIRIAKPIKTVPISLLRCFFESIAKDSPIKAAIKPRFWGLSSNNSVLSEFIPTKEVNQLVRVVPILEPKITPIACLKDISPEFAKPTSITVRAVDDCIAIVSPAPNAILETILEVKRFNERSNFPLEIFSKLVDKRFIPYMKKDRPPSRVIISNKSITLSS